MKLNENVHYLRNTIFNDAHSRIETLECFTSLAMFIGSWIQFPGCLLLAIVLIKPVLRCCLKSR